MHHPFTSAMDEDWDLLDTDPGKVRAKAYDIVMDGWEVGGGSIRIHQRRRQSQMFKALGIGQEEAEEKFGHLLEAFEYGAPPHGGIATGIDRTVAILAGHPLNPRGDRLPEDGERDRPDVPQPVGDRRAAAAGAAPEGGRRIRGPAARRMKAGRALPFAGRRPRRKALRVIIASGYGGATAAFRDGTDPATGESFDRCGVLCYTPSHSALRCS